jgi:predicted DNA-binding transcriptional regulator AlpA
MKGPLEYESKYLAASQKWQKKLLKMEKAYARKYPYWRGDYRKQHLLEILQWKLQRMVGIWNKHHEGQDGYFKNNFLADFYTLGNMAPEKYALQPYGNFIHYDLKRLIRKHSVLATKATAWYTYKKDAFCWSIEEYIDRLSLYNLLRSTVNQKNTQAAGDMVEESASAPTLPSTRQMVEERVGLLDAKQLGALVSKSDVTIRNWAKKAKMPYTIIRGKYYFKRDEVEAWIEERMSTR